MARSKRRRARHKLLHTAVGRYVESCVIGTKAGIGYLALESAKAMWNALVPLLDAPNNRKLLIKPLVTVHQCLKSTRQNDDPDFLVLVYSALFTCLAEQKDWKLGETVVEEAFLYLPMTH